MPHRKFRSWIPGFCLRFRFPSFAFRVLRFDFCLLPFAFVEMLLLFVPNTHCNVNIRCIHEARVGVGVGIRAE